MTHTHRHTRTSVDRAFAALCAAFGWRPAANWQDVGAYTLEKCGSRYRVVRMLPHGATSCAPLGYSLRTAREFYDAAWFAVECQRHTTDRADGQAGIARRAVTAALSASEVPTHASR